MLEQKYDELKASCNKMEVVLKQLAVAQTKKNDTMDLILTKLNMSSQLPEEDDLDKVDMNYRPEADLDERFWCLLVWTKYLDLDRDQWEKQYSQKNNKTKIKFLEEFQI